MEKSKHCLGIWRQAQCTGTDTHTMPQWGAIGTVVALSHNPLEYGHNRWEAAISVLRHYFYTYSRSQNTSWSFLVLSLQSKRRLISKGLRAELSVKERRLYELLLCFYGMCVKIPRGPYYILKYAPTSGTARMPSITEQHYYETSLCSETAGHQGF